MIALLPFLLSALPLGCTRSITPADDSGVGDSGTTDSGGIDILEIEPAVSAGPGWKQVSIAFESLCALRVDGEVVCFGTVHGPQDPIPLEPPDGVTFQQIDAGWKGACGVDDAQKVHCWGNQPTPDTGGQPVTQVSVGTNMACAVTVDGGTHCARFNGDEPDLDYVNTLEAAEVRVGFATEGAVLTGDGRAVVFGNHAVCTSIADESHQPDANWRLRDIDTTRCGGLGVDRETGAILEWGLYAYAPPPGNWLAVDTEQGGGGVPVESL